MYVKRKDGTLECRVTRNELRSIVLDALYYLDPSQHDDHVWSWLDDLCHRTGIGGYCHIVENTRRDASKRHTRPL